MIFRLLQPKQGFGWGIGVSTDLPCAAGQCSSARFPLSKHPRPCGGGAGELQQAEYK